MRSGGDVGGIRSGGGHRDVGHCRGRILIELLDCLLCARCYTLDRGLEDVHATLQRRDEIVELVFEGAKPCLECSHEHFGSRFEETLVGGYILCTILANVFDGFPELGSGLVEGCASLCE